MSSLPRGLLLVDDEYIAVGWPHCGGQRIIRAGICQTCGGGVKQPVISEATYQRIQNDFTFHPADTPARVAQHEVVRDICRRAAEQLCVQVPEGREQSLMLTNLEQAMMWANAGIARQD